MGFHQKVLEKDGWVELRPDFGGEGVRTIEEHEWVELRPDFDPTQPVDGEEEGRSPTTDRQWLNKTIIYLAIEESMLIASFQ